MSESSLDGLLRAVRAELPGSTPMQRASLVTGVVLAVYNYVKFQEPEGGGLDGRQGPERSGLALIVDAAREHEAWALRRELEAEEG